MVKVRAEEMKVSNNRRGVRSPMVKPSTTAAATPTAADSVGVAMPANRLPSTETIRNRIGQTARAARSVSRQGKRGSVGTAARLCRTETSM